MLYRRIIAMCALFSIALSQPAVSLNAAEQDGIIEIGVNVVLEKLPLIKQERMKTFQEKVHAYLNEYKWLDEGDDDLPPFKADVQIFLEDRPSNIEDRYRCQIVVSGPDVQYIDTRSNFAFQEGELLEHDGQATSLKQLLDFYVYLVIAGEFDKMGYLEGAPYLAKARAALEQGKFVRFNFGWDRREDLMKKIEGPNYERFREMKDYYFYGLSILEEDDQKARAYMAKAIRMLRETMKNDTDLEAAENFIGAHYQEVLDAFRDLSDQEPIRILKELDPDREEIYDRYLN